MLKVPFPAGRIFAVTEVVNLRPVENLLDAATDAAAGLRCLAARSASRNLMTIGASISATLRSPKALLARCERLLPLPLMLGVAELLQVLGKVCLDARAERHLAGLFVEIGFALCRLSRRCGTR